MRAASDFGRLAAAVWASEAPSLPHLKGLLPIAKEGARGKQDHGRNDEPRKKSGPAKYKRNHRCRECDTEKSRNNVVHVRAS